MHPATKASVTRDRFADFPALAALGFVGEDLALLARQGFLCLETRRTKSYTKLRFRRDGQQHVKYVATANRAAVQCELEILQLTIRTRRDLAQLIRSARTILRNAKSALQPLIEQRGYQFHGQAVRRPNKNDVLTISSPNARRSFYGKPAHTRSTRR